MTRKAWQQALVNHWEAVGRDYLHLAQQLKKKIPDVDADELSLLHEQLEAYGTLYDVLGKRVDKLLAAEAKAAGGIVKDGE
jgi:hypothetical protein